MENVPNGVSSFPLIAPERLEKADKILFFVQLAIGDFTYMQNFFRAFKQQYPHLKIDLWVDDGRRTWCFWRWNDYKNYVLYDWVETCGLFDTVYKESYAWPLFYKSIRRAQLEKYPIVCMFGMLRTHRVARYVRKIAPQGFIAGLVKEGKVRWGHRHFDVHVPFTLKGGDHISQIYADIFEKAFGLAVSHEDRYPFVKIPHDWQMYGKLKLLYWGIGAKNRHELPVVFVNCFAKNYSRCWPVENVLELIKQLKSTVDFSENQARTCEGLFANAFFIINALPEEFAAVEKALAEAKLSNVKVFTAHENFYQLPSMVSLADLVISVDTSVVHLATAFRRPLVVLMRSKQAEWKPRDVERTAVIVALNKGRVPTIPVAQVVQTTQQLAKRFIKNQARTCEKESGASCGAEVQGLLAGSTLCE